MVKKLWNPWKNGGLAVKNGGLMGLIGIHLAEDLGKDMG